MPELFTFPRNAVPREIAAQIRSYIRIQWPQLDATAGRIWPPAPPDALTFVLMDGELLVAHAGVRRWDFPFDGRPLKVLGLSSVFTYPAWRGAGHGRRMVTAATEHMLRDPDADAGILFCAEPRVRFYESAGWINMPTTTTLEGDPERPTVHPCRMMFLPITDVGGETHRRFQNARVYVGPTTW